MFLCLVRLTSHNTKLIYVYRVCNVLGQLPWQNNGDCHCFFYVTVVAIGRIKRM